MTNTKCMSHFYVILFLFWEGYLCERNILIWAIIVNYCLIVKPNKAALTYTLGHFCIASRNQCGALLLPGTLFASGPTALPHYAEQSCTEKEAPVTWLILSHVFNGNLICSWVLSLRPVTLPLHSIPEGDVATQVVQCHLISHGEDRCQSQLLYPQMASEDVSQMWAALGGLYSNCPWNSSHREIGEGKAVYGAEGFTGKTVRRLQHQEVEGKIQKGRTSLGWGEPPSL